MRTDLDYRSIPAMALSSGDRFGDSIAIIDGADQQCLSCGSTDGEILSPERVKEGFDAGAYHNFDLATGGPAKRKRRP